MSFLTPLFFLGVAALAAPVLVHLVRRTRARRVEFPALVFVRQVPQRTIRRRTLHNLLLMLLRNAAQAESARATVILLDASLSMRQGEHFAEAKRRADALTNAALPDERLAL